MRNGLYISLKIARNDLKKVVLKTFLTAKYRLLKWSLMWLVFVCQPVPSAYLPACLPACLSVCLPIYLSDYDHGLTQSVSPGCTSRCVLDYFFGFFPSRSVYATRYTSMGSWSRGLFNGFLNSQLRPQGFYHRLNGTESPGDEVAQMFLVG